MLKPTLYIGLRLELTRKDDLRVHLTRVEDISSLEFAVGVPYGNKSVDVFHPGEELFCWFADKDTQALWGFTTRVLRREIHRIPLYYLSLPTDFSRVQRRGFFRLPVIVSAQYRLVGESHWHKGAVIDISGGGVRLSHREPLNYLDMVQVTFSLHKTDPHFILQGRVVRVERIDSSGVLMYHTGIEFINLPMGTQDRLVGFVFARLSATKRFRGE